MKKNCAALLVAILCFSVISLFVLTVNAQAGGSWPMFHGDSAHTGYSTTIGPSDNQTLWVFKTSGKVWSSPAVVNGMVYFGSFDKNVYAVNVNSGKQVWIFPTGGTIYPSPAVFNNIVYIGSNDHNLYALNAKSGALVWNYKTGGEVQTSPAVSSGIVYFGSHDDRLYALNATSGAFIWVFSLAAASSLLPP